MDQTSYKYVPLMKLGDFHKLKHIQKKTEKDVKGVSQTTKLFGRKGVSYLREIAAVSMTSQGLLYSV